ncbi:hypothetical protein [Nocardia barduliensis]|uniref:hypothetical protein n=1 Tax=Nocardia barduliensis TaxID=2736643 RepID=UPI0015731990|nr:hypothetical protein [Nocardia barduliensis]
MTGDLWVWLGFVAAAGIPAVVFVVAVLWPERVPPDRTVEAIRQRIEDEGDPPPAL